MALQYSVTVRNAKLDLVETAIGTSAVLRSARPRVGALPRAGTAPGRLHWDGAGVTITLPPTG